MGSKQRIPMPGRFICGVTRGKHKYFCRRCSWTCSQRGVSGLFEHAIFGINVKLPAYVALHQLETTNQVPDDMKDFINKYRSAGNCTSPCTDPVGKQKALTMADCGEPAAALGTKHMARPKCILRLRKRMWPFGALAALDCCRCAVVVHWAWLKCVLGGFENVCGRLGPWNLGLL